MDREGRLGSWRKSWKAAALVGVAVAGGGAALAVASVPDGSGVIHACVAMQRGVPATGANVRIIDSAAGQTCSTSSTAGAPPAEQTLNWNVTGPQGTPGAPGTPGANGSPGKSVTIASGNTFTISGGQVITVGGAGGVTIASPPVNERGPGIGQANLTSNPSLAFDVLSVSLAGGSVGAGTGVGAGKVAIHEITITKKLDAASPKLSQACAQGKHFSKATITLRKAGKPYLTYGLTNVQISSYQVSGAASGGTVPVDRLTLNYTSIKIQYSKQK